MDFKQKIVLLLILLLAILLRLWGLDSVPVSLFGDELDVGYQSYSILKTGRDYFGNFLPFHFKSLAEYRTPFYPYTAVPTIALFGISAWGVRLPIAIFGILTVLALYLLVKEITKNENLSLLSAFLLSISPWHIHFSRAGFDGPQMLFLYTLGIYFLLISFRSKNTLWLSAFFLAFTPWAYNTAKLFLPLTILAILIIWKDDLLKIPKRRLFLAIITFIVITAPFLISTVFGGGTERIQGISIFNDPTVIPQMGFDRQNDVGVRGNSSQSVTIFDKLFHNKITSYSQIFTNNYLQSFSTEFLFIKGDSQNLRQSSGEEFYKYQFIFLILGLVFLITSNLDKKIKIFLILWILASPVPSALTQGGGVHATRLILMLLPLNILTAFGIYYSYIKINKKFKTPFVILISLLILLGFVFYQHNYWIHYPWKSERWWHGGFKDAIQSAVSEGEKYDKVIISGADEPPLIFFLSLSQYSPSDFQQKYPLAKEFLSGFGEVDKLDKYYFPAIGVGKNLYELGSILPDNALYLATFKEINLDLIKEPERVPQDIKLVKIINYPSGNPAFYLFTRP